MLTLTPSGLNQYGYTTLKASCLKMSEVKKSFKTTLNS